MLRDLLTEQPNPASAELDRLDTRELLSVINEQDRHIAEAVKAVIPAIATAVDAIVAALQKNGRLFYVGAGTSGRLGVLDASECTPTYGAPPEMVQGIMAGGETALWRSSEGTEDDESAGEHDLTAKGVRFGDAVVGIAASGRTPYVLGAIRFANTVGAVTIGISCTPDSELSKAVKIAIEVLTGPEVVTGSTRMKAGTATKLVLNMLSTAAMVRLGYVYGNLMVNVQPTNEKLVDRASRVIAQAAGVSYEEASALLAKTGDVKLSIVMAKRRVDEHAAAELLRQNGGRVRQALES